MAVYFPVEVGSRDVYKRQLQGRYSVENELNSWALDFEDTVYRLLKVYMESKESGIKVTQDDESCLLYTSNIVNVVGNCIGAFYFNKTVIRYLWNYYKGCLLYTSVKR